MARVSLSSTWRACVLKAIVLSILVPEVISARTAGGADSAPRVLFERNIWPIIAANCIGCHGAEKPKGGLDLRSVSRMLKGGEEGPALDLADPDRSLLVEKITRGEMPPGKARKLSRDEVAKIRAWVRSGAKAEHPEAVPAVDFKIRDRDRRFWSFRMLQKPLVPKVAAANRARTPIDRFLLHRLEQNGLSFSPDADRATVLRRLCLDLTGIPPSPDQIDSFENDHEPGAYERLVDRVLDSPRFGQRWGRHWLDIAGYVDTVGFDTDATNIITSEGKWRYRDYVIAAFNADKPYDRFITEQIAGDELHDWRNTAHWTPEIREALIATGYLRTARDLTQEDVGVIPQNFFGILHDTLEIVGTGLLGLTVNCARCHDHKFDPIPQEDYYRMIAIFTPAYDPGNWLPVVPTETRKYDRGLADVSPAERAELERHNAAIDRDLEVLGRQVNQVRQACHDRLFATRLNALSEPIRADTKTALRTPREKRSEVQKYLADKFASALAVKPDEVTAALLPAEKTAAAQLEAQMRSTKARRRTWSKIQALYDVGPPPRSHLLVRGNEQTPGPEVSPGYLRAALRLGCLERRAALGPIRTHQRPAAGAGAVADATGFTGIGPAGARDGEPDLEPSLRRRHRDDARQLRHSGTAAHPSRAARVARLGIRGRRLALETADPVDGGLDGLPPGVAPRRGGHDSRRQGSGDDRSRQPAALEDEAAAARRRGSARRAPGHQRRSRSGGGGAADPDQGASRWNGYCGG